jgi:hypothetical protein
LDKKIESFSPSLMNDIEICNEEDTKAELSKLFYQSNSQFVYDTCLLSLSPDTSDIVINKDFFLGFIHLDLLSELNIPLIQASLVREKQFQKFEYN